MFFKTDNAPASANFPPASSRKWPSSTKTARRPKVSSRARAIKSKLNGNISLGEFTNRVQFDGRLQFSSAARLARTEPENFLAHRHRGNPFGRHQSKCPSQNHRRRPQHRRDRSLHRFAKSHRAAAHASPEISAAIFWTDLTCPASRKIPPRSRKTSTGTRTANASDDRPRAGFRLSSRNAGAAK